MPYKDPAKTLEHYHKRYAAHKEQMNKYSRERYATHKKQYAVSMKKWYRNNKKKHAANGAAWMQKKENRKKHQLSVSQWKLSNKEKCVLDNHNWKQNNKDKCQASLLRYRARKNKAAGSSYTTTQHIAWRWAMWGDNCYICGAKAVATDHVIPLSRRGTHWPANLRPTCLSCNSQKHNKSLSIFLSEKKMGVAI